MVVMPFVIIITDTWLAVEVSDQHCYGDMTPHGYSFHHAARIQKKGGGVGILFRDYWKSEAQLGVFWKLPTHFCFCGHVFM